MDLDLKVCKSCNQEFNEKQNFNWSCRTHHYAFSGEIWWCCGKRGQNEPGCKFAKHQSKEDEDEYDEKKDQKKSASEANQKCYCCKEIGHSIENCPMDPNFKTKKTTRDELKRILKIRNNNRKLFADTVIQTAHMLKKLIRVPKVYLEQPDLPGFGVPEDQFEIEIEKQMSNIFQRGVMMFEDFNYNQFNRFILIDPEKQQVKDRDGDIPMYFQDMAGEESDKNQHELTEGLLKNSIKDDYEQKLISVTIDREQEEAVKIIEAEKVEESKEPLSPDIIKGKSNKDEVEVIEDEIEYEVYYD